jgi:hypothetical protein
MAQGTVEAQELPDVRRLAEDLIRAVDEARGGRLCAGACDLRLHYVDGDFRFLVPAPKVGADEFSAEGDTTLGPGPS